MPISIITDIQQRIPSSNPNFIQAETDNYVILSGTPGVWVYNISQPDNNSTMDFTFGNDTFTITFKTTPNDSGYEANRPNDLTTMNQFVGYLLKNRFLARWFEISSTWSGSAGTFTLTQKEVSSDLIYSATPSGTSNIGLDSGASTVQVNRTFQENFKMMCDLEHYYQIYDLVNPLYTRLLATLESTPGPLAGIGDWASFFNVSDVMRSVLSYDPPEYDENDTLVCPNMVAYFKYRLYEMYGSPSLPYYIEETFLTYTAILSKLSFSEHSNLDFNADYCTATYRKFLSNRPSGCWTNKEAPQYLYAFYKPTETSSKLYVKLYYDDGTTSADTLIRTVAVDPSGHFGRVVRAAVGYDHLDLDTIAGVKIVHHYECWLETASDRITEIFTFTVDLRPYQHNNYILFSSPKGGFDTLWCRGELNYARDNFGEETMSPILPGYDNGNISLRNTGFQEQFEFNTGIIESIDELRWASEIAIAEEVYWMKDGALKRIVIDQKSVKDLDSSLENIHSISFKAQLANLE